MKEKKTFIPDDKPKSWVLGIISGLVGIILAVPILLLSMHYDIFILRVIGQSIFIICCLSFAINWLIFAPGLISGKYKNIEAKKWNKQLW